MIVRWLVAAFLLVVLTGCKTDEPELVFRGAPPASGPSLSLRAAALDDRRLLVDVMGHELDDLYGVAFRVAFDARVLRFSQIGSGAAFAYAPELVLAAREARPGLVVAALTRQGRQPGVSARGTPIATLSFDIALRGASRVALVQSRASALASDGLPIELQVTSGELAID